MWLLSFFEGVEYLPTNWIDEDGQSYGSFFIATYTSDGNLK